MKNPFIGLPPSQKSLWADAVVRRGARGAVDRQELSVTNVGMVQASGRGETRRSRFRRQRLPAL